MTGRPLQGMRVAVTRSRAQADDLARRLAALGAEAIPAPVIAFRPPADTAPLDEALGRLHTYRWLVLSSTNGVDAVFDRLRDLGLALVLPAGVRVAAIGPGTARALAARGVEADLVPERFIAESLVEAIRLTRPAPGDRALVARAAQARSTLPDGLAALGMAVDVVAAYETVADAGLLPDLSDVDVVTFTSASTVRGLVERLGPEGTARLAARARLASIGPITSAALADAGLAPAVEAARHDIQGLVDAVVSLAGDRSARA